MRALPARDDYERGDARHREIALAVGDLPPCRALTGLGDRDPDFGDHLAVGERGRERAGEELRRRDRPGAFGAPDADLGLARGEHGGHLGSRIRVTDVAAERAAIADRAVRHVSIGFHHERAVRRDHLRIQQHRVPRERADDELAALDPDVGKAGDAVDVDENGGLHEPEIHHRHQALSAGKNPAGRCVARERLERLGKRTRPDVLERCWFHVHLLWS